MLRFILPQLLSISLSVPPPPPPPVSTFISYLGSIRVVRREPDTLHQLIIDILLIHVHLLEHLFRHQTMKE